MTEPTADECYRHARVALTSDLTGVACWYPSMGGYVGKAVAVVDEDGCIDVYVWHDGDFPFHGDPVFGGRSPVKLHHCDPGDFVRFGQFLDTLIEH